MGIEISKTKGHCFKVRGGYLKGGLRGKLINTVQLIFGTARGGGRVRYYHYVEEHI